jgi:phospholipid/cholesterol/gamma-HCH transport system substrate-binding protein
VLVNLLRDNDPAEHRKLFLAGIVFLIVNGLLIALSIAIYQKVFQPVVMVTLKADRAGLQLAQFGDVRMHGVLIGQVRKISQKGDEADIEIGLKPAAAKSIPSNIRVTILPTTLFGQKYVNVIVPKQASSTPIADGDVIPASRVQTSVELSKVFDKLFPLLRAVRPADLNATLNALATALEGRGDQIGRSLDNLDAYLTDMNPHLPELRADLRLLAHVSKSYQIAAPDLIRILRNTTVTSQTVVEKQADLESFFKDVSGVAETASQVLGTNEQNLIRLGQLSRPALALLDTYSPEYPCLLKGIARYRHRLGAIFAGGRVKQFIETGSVQRRAYDARDKPVYGEVGHGPWCLGLPYPPEPIGPHPLKDGSNEDSSPGSSLTPPPPVATPGLFGNTSFSASSGFAGTKAEQQVIDTILATRTGRTADSIPPVASLLYGPIIRGTRVNT